MFCCVYKVLRLVLKKPRFLMGLLRAVGGRNASTAIPMKLIKPITPNIRVKPAAIKNSMTPNWKPFNVCSASRVKLIYLIELCGDEKPSPQIKFTYYIDRYMRSSG